MKPGDTVMANGHPSAQGLPYFAEVLAIEGDRVKVRPLPESKPLTASTARSQYSRKGPSVRARWVSLAHLLSTEWNRKTAQPGA